MRPLFSGRQGASDQRQDGAGYFETQPKENKLHSTTGGRRGAGFGEADGRLVFTPTQKPVRLDFIAKEHEAGR